MENLKALLRTTDAHVRALAEMGIVSAADLLTYFPRAHIDLSHTGSIAEIREGETATVSGVLTSLKTIRTKSSKWMIQGELREGGSTLRLSWFNQPYVARVLKAGDELIVTGSVKRFGRQHSMTVNSFEHVSEDMHHTGGLIPLYRGHGAISSKWLRDKLFPLLKTTSLPEILPDWMQSEYALLPRNVAVQAFHFPKDLASKDAARHRFAFEELVILHTLSLLKKKRRQEESGSAPQIPLSPTLVQQFTDTLPFTFTAAQKRVAAEILTDMSSSAPMHRLLIGETGSGKTAVALLAAWQALSAGVQVALLAPTEILAKQHAKNVLKTLHALDVPVALLTGSTPLAEKKDIHAKLKNGTLSFVVGTHALLSEGVTFKHLGLAIIDEQHRFGVEQRSRLAEGANLHRLMLTATPIPRTLALTLFGDTEVSTIDELPPGRQEILTRIVPEDKRRDAELWIRSEIAKGKQAFIVCPLVADSDKLGVKSAEGEYARLQAGALKDTRIALLHGRMKPAEKDDIMRTFAAGEADILVSTSVIEVGIDVPNATIMVIEGAERFGLSQLHQFRGRVGRGTEKSYCFLFGSTVDDTERERLKALEKTSSGFALAEVDLALRGPGELFGIRQSGIPDLRVARFTDTALIEQTRLAAERLIATPNAEDANPLLFERVHTLLAHSSEE